MKTTGKNRRTYLNIFGIGVFAGSCLAVAFSADLPSTLNPASMRAVSNVDVRFQAYNIEMLEVTGGRFWKPYKELQTNSAQNDTDRPGSTPPGMSANMYQYRPPTDLKNARLRKLAAALGPAYVRVSGTWANTTYFYDASGPAPKTPPKGFNSALTREQWKGVIDFSHAVNAEIVTSFAVSDGTRNAEGVWMPDQARAFLSYTKSAGGKIAAAEFMNEPNLATIGGAPKGYDAAAYARDTALFHNFLKNTSPGTLFAGPGSVGENSSTAVPLGNGMLPSRDVLKAVGPVYDIFSYHLYPAISQRCAAISPAMGTTAAVALSTEWLARPGAINGYYTSLRDEFEPGKPIWITEAADAACGGNPWASTFLDTFRYVDEHARLAQQGVRVIFHNTLAASDYSLVDENTFAPRPNYWAALLWHRLMGTIVLKPASSGAGDLRLYAHCMDGVPGGVTLLAINTNRHHPQPLAVSAASEQYTLTAPILEGTRVDLNGTELKLVSDDSIPALNGVPVSAGSITLPPASITFLAVRNAKNASCR